MEGQIRRLFSILAIFLAMPAAAQDFTTAAEVRPVLTATRSSWIAIREFDGQDLIYFTQLESWRCGLSGVTYSVNGGGAQPWSLEQCYEGTAVPNAIRGAGGQPYAVAPLKSVDTVRVLITYDDGTTDSATYQRAAVLIP